MSKATDFLNGEMEDNTEITIQAILRATDDELEKRHDWIQWAFPIPEKSMFNPNAPTMSKEEAKNLSKNAIQTLLYVSYRYQRFLERRQDWYRSGNHNHRRITRAMKCLGNAGLLGEVKKFWELTQHADPTPETARIWRETFEEFFH